MSSGLAHALQRPHRTARDLVQQQKIYGLVDVDVRFSGRRTAVYWMTLDPWSPMAEKRYPRERVAITVHTGGLITAVPLNASARQWLHREQFVWGSAEQIGALCLWFRDDPSALRWEWEDGLASYVTIVHRHLQAEEYWRRNDEWPGEDAPHGPGPHPIRTIEMRRIVARAA